MGEQWTVKRRLLIIPLLLVPGSVPAGVSRRVDVVAQVPPVYHVEGPTIVDMAPGESRAVTIQVACNQAWVLAVSTDNPQVSVSGRYSGTPGGTAATGHIFPITLVCAAGAKGPQHATLTARLLPDALMTASQP